MTASNYAADMISGFNVNTIALQVPISMLVSSAGNSGYRHVGRDLSAGADGPQCSESDHHLGHIAASEPHGQSAHQRTDHRYGLQGHV